MSRRAPAAIAVGNCDGELAGAPHDEQKRTFSGTSAAQLGQRTMVADCTPGPCGTGVLACAIFPGSAGVSPATMRLRRRAAVPPTAGVPPAG